MSFFILLLYLANLVCKIITKNFTFSSQIVLKSIKILTLTHTIKKINELKQNNNLQIYKFE